MAEKKKTLAIFTLVKHKQKNGQFYGYGPYVREMNIWTANFDNILIVAPLSNLNSIDAIDVAYNHSNISVISVPSFHVKSIGSSLSLLLKLPGIFIKTFDVMRKADHLHFRCPSNIAALASIVQICFPNKIKTVKYAGNWDPKSEQPFGYRFQKWIFSNTFFTKNTTILAYGEWKNQSKYVLPFYTATFSQLDKVAFKKRQYSQKLKFVFLGSLVDGKRPLLVIKIIEVLINKGIASELHMFGDGILKSRLQNYIENNTLNNTVVIHGNKNMDVIKEHLKDAHFTILPSKSEGWPKALAEGMFFGTIPISTDVSCISWMLDHGHRGIVIEPNLNKAVGLIAEELAKGDLYLNTMAQNAQEWSQAFTTERFEKDIKALITKA